MGPYGYAKECFETETRSLTFLGLKGFIFFFPNCKEQMIHKHLCFKVITVYTSTTALGKCDTLDQRHNYFDIMTFDIMSRC